jgi:hypothetical protein
MSSDSLSFLVIHITTLFFICHLSSVIAQSKTVAYREPLWGCLTIKKVW